MKNINNSVFKFVYNRFFELSNNYIDLGQEGIFCNPIFRILIYLRKFTFNKYFLLDFIIQLYLVFFSIIFLPIAIILYLFNFKIYNISNHSFGDFLLEMSILKKHYSKYKILLPTNFNYKFEQYEKIMFPELSFIKNFIFSHILNVINIWNFVSLNIYNNKKKIIEPKHYIHRKNWNKELLSLREHYIFNYIKNLKFKLQNKKIFEKLFLNRYKKIVIINPRSILHRKNKLRNSNLKNYLKTINFLKKKKFKVFLFSDNLNIRNFCKRNNVKFFNINEPLNKLIQIFTFSKCDLYIGSYSGMGHFTDLFKTKSIYVDEVFYNSVILNKNSYVLPKKILLNDKILNYRDIVAKNLDSIFIDKDIKNKKIKLINVSEKELFNTTKKILSGNENRIKVSKIENLPTIIDNLAFSYYKMNKNLFN